MKKLIILLFPVVMTACANKQPIVVTAAVPMQEVKTTGTQLTGAAAAQVRNPEIVTEYSAGPYIDPANPNVRHDEHDIQRVDQSANWNLRPQGAGYYAAAPVSQVPDSAETTPLTAQFEQELERQKAYTAALQEQNNAMLQKLESVNRLLADADRERAQTEALRKQVEELGKQVETLKTPPPAPAPVQKKGWSLKSLFGGK